MTFIKVDQVPRRAKKNLVLFFDEFMSANIKVAKVEFSKCDYKDSKVARNCLQEAARRHGVPITVERIGDEVYFTRNDM